MKRLLMSFVAASVLLSAGDIFSQYRKIDYEPPAELGPGVKDSILHATLPPIPRYPTKGKKARIKTVVWLKVTVGEEGEVMHAEVVRCITPGYGFEQAALDAVKTAKFRPGWDGIYPCEYIGYFPLLYTNPDAVGYEWTDEAGRHRVGAGTKVRGPGYDAPIVEPIEPLVLGYPVQAIRDLVEAIAYTKVQIDKEGKVAKAEAWDVSDNDYGFGKAAVEAVKRSLFPIKYKKERPVEYGAYVRATFSLSADALAKVGIPGPHEPQPVDSPPAFAEKRRPIYYIKEVMDNNLEGTAVISAYISTKGKAQIAVVDSSSGHVLLDSNAIIEVRRALFRPASKSGNPVPAWVNLDMRYSSKPDIPGLTTPLGETDTVIYIVKGPNTGGARAETTFVYHITDTSLAMSSDESVEQGFSRQVGSGYANIEPPEVLPKFTRFEKAVYPIEAWSTGVEGSVKLAALIDEKGKVLEKTIAYSSNNPFLDSAALATVPKHAFTPGTTEGKPVKAWISWFVRFKPGSKEVIIPGATDDLVRPKAVYIEEPVYTSVRGLLPTVATTTLQLYVDTSGTVLEARLLKSSGYQGLDDAALAVAPKYRFTPALYKGRPQRFWLKYDVVYDQRKALGIRNK